MSHTVPPVLSVVPSRALVDEKFRVLVENLPPGAPVTLHSLHQSEDKDYWEAYGHYISDERGAVSVADDLSFGGTYTGKEAMGLLWSMRPVPGSRDALRLRKSDVCTPLLVNISVYSGHVTEGFREQTPLASSITERWYMAPGVQRIVLKDKGVGGTLFIPPGPGPFPGVLDMWGGGGGLVEYRAALLASHGYVSLALQYLDPNALKSADLEYEYFERAFNIVKEHPQVIPDRVGCLGLSLGANITMSLAAESNVVKPRCGVCIGGGHLFGRLTNLKDWMNRIPEGLPVDENNHERWRSVCLPIPEDPSLKLEVGKIKCPMLLVNGLDDQNWAAVECADDIAKMMRAAGKEHLLTRLHYPDAGHLIEPPYSPHFRASKFKKVTTKRIVILLWGGQTKPHADAQEDAWNKILSFLQQHLYSNTTPKARM
ncbi:peroxisomal succinyl-coenzyme A thioesterase-like isoform X2 [Centropristis striata]|nr:peroxisomal succinyl-coenzyme A thioesterase-like isoform X2 [Centropristis striata]XP_059181490.1 peroxisomal succinyl-coenzyme A thioesterase-like isoform X2 [Centropristis striata]